MNKITYQTAALADIPELISLRFTFIEELSGHVHDTAERAMLAQNLSDYYHEAIVNKSHCSIIARDGSQPAASADLCLRTQPGNFRNPSGRIGYIMNVYTFPAYRRKGIARRLVELLLEAGRSMDIHMFELHATRDGAPVYEQAGFVMHTEPTYRMFLP